MARTTFSGPVRSLNGFEGTLTLTEAPNTIITTSAATTGTYQPLVVSTTMAGAGANGGRAKFDMSTNVALGSFTNALKAEVTYGASGRTTGLGSAFVAEMTLSAGTTSGTYAPLEIELNAPTGAKTGTLTSFIHISTQGAAVGEVDDNAVLFNLQGVTSGAGHIWKTGSTLGTAAGAIRVRVGTTNYWMPVYAAEPT